MTQLAEQLDRATLELALRIVPIDWWREQLGRRSDTPSAPVTSPATRSELPRNVPVGRRQAP